MTNTYTLTYEDVKGLMESIYLSVLDLSKSKTSEFYPKFVKLLRISEYNFEQPDVGLKEWIRLGKDHKSLFQYKDKE